MILQGEKNGKIDLRSLKTFSKVFFSLCDGKLERKKDKLHVIPRTGSR